MKLLDVLYEAGSRVRNAAYDRKALSPNRLSGVVISVGNLTVGGTGKTPMVLWIAQRLLAEGKKVGILTRGYRGGSRPADSSDGSVPTSAGASSAGPYSADNSSSDEVQMLSSRLGGRVAFGVGPNRFARGRELAARGIDWFVLDDGFQHRQLARDVDIVLIDATNPFGGGHLLPSGRLREPRSGLSRADIIVITRSEHSPAIEAAVRHDSSAPIFYARPWLDEVHSVNSSVAAPQDISANPLNDLARAQKVFAFCGIGNPSAFLADLRDWGFQVAEHKFYRDHHRYSPRDLDEIQAEASSAGASSLVCTEKDVFNLPHDLSHASSQATMPIFYCRISMRIDREDELWRAILAKSSSRG